MFLSDLSENVALFRRKRYEEYLRENKPELSAEIEKNRKYIAGKMSAYKDGTKQKENAHKSFRKKLREKIDVLKPTETTNSLRDLKRFEPLPNLKNTLPDLSVLKRKQALPPLSNPLPELTLSQRRKTEAFNPVKDTFNATSGRKPMTEIIVKKAPKPSTKDTKKLLKTLGVAGVVSGGLLGAYGLKKYSDAKKDKRR